jgi:hypothetical protein
MITSVAGASVGCVWATCVLAGDEVAVALVAGVGGLFLGLSDRVGGRHDDGGREGEDDHGELHCCGGVLLMKSVLGLTLRLVSERVLELGEAGFVGVWWCLQREGRRFKSGSRCERGLWARVSDTGRRLPE